MSIHCKLPSGHIVRADMKLFRAECRKNGKCYVSTQTASDAYVPAITVCNQGLDDHLACNRITLDFSDQFNRPDFS